jgi:Ca-activated chloride channel family protein
MRASVRFDHELLAVEHDHDVSCMLELTAPPAPPNAERRPLAIALVIDRSGSMAGDKLDVTRRSAAFLVERLAPGDRLGIVSFDDEVRLEAPLLQVGPNRAVLLAAINAIASGGQTNLSGGWLKGVELLSPLDESFTRRTLLLTDGRANTGIVDDLQLAKMARASAGDGIGTSTVGFGEGFSEDLLAAMADAGNGGAYFAEGPDAAPGIFAQEFEDLLRLVAQNVSIEIRPGWDQVNLLSVLNDFPQVPVDGGVQLQLGDAYGDEQRRIVFQLRVPSLATMGPSKIAEVIIRYVEIGEQVAMHQVAVPLIVNAVSADDAAASVPNAHVVEEVVILLGARAQEEARALADAGDYESARAKLTDAAKDLRARAPGSHRADELLAQADTWEQRAEMLAPDSWAMDRKRMTYENRTIKERRDRGPR